MARALDYVSGRVLPYMHQTPASVDALVRDFTVDEAKQLQLERLPVMMNHNDGEIDDETGRVRDLDCVGWVDGFSVNGVDARVLMAIQPYGEHSNTLTSNYIADGTYSGISLGNRVDSKSSAETGQNLLIKTPTEVSICKRGRRHGSTIEHFMPCRATCERLLAAGNKEIAGMANRFGYAADLQRKGVTPADGKAYIDCLVDLSEQRLAAFKSTAVKKHSVSIRAAMSAESDANAAAKKIFTAPAAAAADSDAMDVDAAGSAAAATSAAAAAPPAQRASTIELPDLPDVRNAKQMAAEAIKAREEAVDLRRQLVEAKKAEFELKTIKDTEARKKKEEFDTIVRSYIENAQKLNHDADQIQQTVGCAQDLFKDKPESALGLIKSSLAMSIKASQQMSTYESMQAQQLAKHTHSKNNEFFDNASLRLAALREQDRSFSLSQAMPAGTSVPLTSLTNEQIASIAMSSSSSSSSSSSAFDRRYTDAGRQQQQQQQQMMMQSRQEAAVEKPAAPMFVRASESDPGTNDYDARGQFEQQKKLFGRIPSIRDVSYGVKVEHTGEMKASASGEKVPVTRVVPLRQSPAVVEPANFAPEWAATLDRAIQARQNSGVRYLGRDVVRMTHQGSGYNA